MHVAIVELERNSKFFAKHGLHLNNTGKEWLANTITSQVDKIINSMNTAKTVVALSWKEDKINENEFSEVSLSSQIQNRQDDTATSEVSHRTSQNKATFMRSKDFL
jgi:alpha-N-acetylglucosamine transferase